MATSAARYPMMRGRHRSGRNAVVAALLGLFVVSCGEEGLESPPGSFGVNVTVRLLGDLPARTTEVVLDVSGDETFRQVLAAGKFIGGEARVHYVPVIQAGVLQFVATATEGGAVIGKSATGIVALQAGRAVSIVIDVEPGASVGNDGSVPDAGDAGAAGPDTSSDATDAATSATLKVVLHGNGTGVVTSSPAGIDCGADCSQVYNLGTRVTLTAAPAAGTTFVGWTGGGCNGTGTCMVTITADVEVGATFALNNSLVVVSIGNGTGTVTSNPAGIDCGADCSEAYTPGTSVTLTAAPGTGSTFAGWAGGGCMGAGTCVVTVDAALMVTATFTLTTHMLTVTTNGNGTGTVTGTGINCGADCSETVDYGTMVVLTAVPAAGSVFTGWSGGGCAGTGTCSLTVNAAAAVTATFTLTTHTISVTKNGTGGGTVIGTGINCGADCSETVDYGTMVVLNAAPVVGSVFTGWSGGGCAGTGTCTTSVIAATTVTATFTLSTHALTVAVNGNGTGTVTGNGINCGADCSETVDYGTMIVLTAAPGTGSVFTGWSGGGCAGTGTCTVTMTAATGVTATFTLTTHLLTVGKAGNGAGTITGTGINCGADCTETVDYGTVVSMTAAPAAGSVFAGWSGGGCAGTGACSVTMTAATSVTATFTLTMHVLNVTRAGNGTGTISGPGINCGADCTETVNYGTTVDLTAATPVGSVFTGWSGGGCAGTGTCTLTMTTATNVTATFTLTTHLLTVTRAGNGTGTVTGTGINCGADCTETMDYGTSVVLTAMPVAGSTFSGWSGGGCSGTGTCTVTVTAATNVTATFTGDPFVNGSFENDYAGWTLDEDSGDPQFGAWGIGTNGQMLTMGLIVHDFFDNIDFSPGCFFLGPLIVTTAAGNKAAYNSQSGPENHRIWQDIPIAAGRSTLSWSMLYQNSAPFSPTQNLSIEVRDPATDTIIATPFTTTAASPPSIGLTPMTASLAAFVGQTVRITVNLQAQMSCFFLEVDAFSMIP